MSMTNIAAFPVRESSRRAIRDLLRACEDLKARGERITYPKLAARTGTSIESTGDRARRLERLGRLPYEIESESPPTRAANGSRTELTIEAAGAIEARGEPITYEALGMEMGISQTSTYQAVAKAKLDPRWRWEVGLRKPTDTNREWRIQRSTEASRAALEQSPEELEALVAMRKAEVLATWRAEMIDASQEIDDPPPGVAPRSNKDHAAWGRMKFADSRYDTYEPSDYRPMGGSR